jgi:hypothetical protein
MAVKNTNSKKTYKDTPAKSLRDDKCISKPTKSLPNGKMSDGITSVRKTTSAKGSVMSQSDKLTLKAWKRTYANRNNDA